MRRFVFIGVKKLGSKILDYRLIDVDTRKVSALGLETIDEMLKSGKISIDNMTVEGDKAVGTNGSIDRYGVISLNDRKCIKNSIVIISRIIDNSNNTLGFEITDYTGIVETKNVANTVSICRQIGLANGKLRGNAISSIFGSYREIRN